MTNDNDDKNPVVRRENMGLYSDGHVQYVMDSARSIASHNDAFVDTVEFEALDQLHYLGTSSIDDFLRKYYPDREKDDAIEVNVVDVGAGLGGTPRHLLLSKTEPAHVSYRVVSVEYIEDFVRGFRELNGFCGLPSDDGRLRIVHGDFLHLDDADGVTSHAFDLLVSQLCFLHIVDNHRLWERCHRALRPGSGMVYLEDYFLLCPDTKLPPSVRNLLRTQISIPDGSLLTREGYVDMLEKHGFEVTEWRDSTEEWSAFVWNRCEAFLKHSRSDRETRFGAAYASRIETFYISTAKVLKAHIASLEKAEETWPLTVRILREHSITDMYDWCLFGEDATQYIGGVILVGRALAESST